MPKWQQHHVWRVGLLFVEEQHDRELSRTVRVARFADPQTNADLMPPLHDVQLVSAKPDWITLTGYEIAANGLGKPVHYRQSWVLVPISDEQLRAREETRDEERERMAEFMLKHGGAPPSSPA